MVWIKRNLVLVVSGLVGLSLIGFGTYLVMNGLSRNKQLSEDVEGTRSRANQLYDANPFPSQANIDKAKQETESLKAALARAHGFFKPVPVEKMDVKRFMVWRDELLSGLRDAARRAGTELPAASDYSFSFATQQKKTQFSPDTLPHVPEQMAEVKSICAMLFDARVNRIGNIRRARVCGDDKSSANGSDYTSGTLELVTDTTSHMVSSPYEITFYSFSVEVADVLNRIHRSPHGFLVKAIQVEPEDGKLADAAGPAFPTGNLPVNQTTPPNRGDRFRPPNTNRVVAPTPAARPTASDRPVHLLKEKRLKVTLLLYALKPVTK